MQAQVAPHDAHIGAHNLAHLLQALGDENHLLGVGGAFVVPFGHIIAISILVKVSLGVLSSSFGIHYSLD